MAKKQVLARKKSWVSLLDIVQPTRFRALLDGVSVRFKSLTGLALTIALGGALVVAVPFAPAARAADADFLDPAYIISDNLFFDGAAMPGSQVQQFLNGEVPTCDTGYVCLKDYRQDTPSRAAVSDDCAAYQGRADESAAQIIAKVGVACGISQKAMLVLLEKEQGIVTDASPTARQYRSATGYGCPDTADCDERYSGIFMAQEIRVARTGIAISGVSTRIGSGLR